ncbi:ankyrin repeat-containing domain protein [Xylaria sp. FL0064]|nr:ankyrin repeat-containing domain protein [Xylaria sp. FL0064]
MLQKFPQEIHYIIADLSTEETIASVARVSKQLYQVYNHLLYTRNVRLDNSSAVLGICHMEDPERSVAALRHAIDAGADIRTRSWQTIYAGADSIRTPSRHDPDLHKRHTCCVRPIHIAAWYGCWELVELLLDSGVDLDSLSEDGETYTPLAIAIQTFQTDTALNLLNRGAALISCRHGVTVLHLAASNNLLEVITYLVKEKGMSLSCQNSYGETPLTCAIRSPYATKTSIAHLTALGADWNPQNTRCPLALALRRGKWDLAEQLLKDGAKGDRWQNHRESLEFPYAAMDKAANPESGSSKMIALLLQKGDRINRYQQRRILNFMKEVCDPKIEVGVNWELLRSTSRLAQIFQILFHHHSRVGPEHQDSDMSTFLADCPAWVISVTRSKALHQLKNEDLMIAKIKSN